MMRAAVWILAGLILSGCEWPEAAPPPVTAPQTLPVVQGQLMDPAGKVLPLQIEVADDDAEREKGMMFRTSMADGEAMWFVWPTAEVRTFWMKNTLIPLDMIFLRAGRVVGVISWAKPQDLSPLSVPEPADGVLEVPGGWATKNGVSVGWQLQAER